MLKITGYDINFESEIDFENIFYTLYLDQLGSFFGLVQKAQNLAQALYSTKATWYPGIASFFYSLTISGTVHCPYRESDLTK